MRTPFFVLGGVLLMACGTASSTTPTASQDSEATAAGGDASASVTNGHSGYIAIGQQVNTGFYSLDVDAWFSDTTDAGAAGGGLYPVLVDDAGEAIHTGPAAGQIELLGAHLPTGQLQLTNDPLETPGADLGMGSPYFVGGDTLTVRAAGTSSSVGPFSAQLVAPGDVQLTSPAAKGAVTIVRSQDLVVRWTGGTPGTQVHVNLSAGSPGHGVSLDYFFDAARGEGTVPSAGGLETLPYVDGSSATGGLGLTPVSSTTVMAGNAGGSASAPDAWTITVAASGTPVGASFTAD